MKLKGIEYAKAGRWSTKAEKADFLKKTLEEMIEMIGHLTDVTDEDGYMDEDQIVTIQQEFVPMLENLLYYATGKVVTLDVEYVERVEEYDNEDEKPR
jgi:glutamate dehydrogenase/leucine dehydrogenase